jgi:hypothetical protein
MIALMLMIAALLEPDGEVDLRGTAGICVRWDGPTHVADAVVVVSSGNPALDAALPETIKAMEWQRPAPPYAGGWIGITMAVEGAADSIPLPNCAELQAPDH